MRFCFRSVHWGEWYTGGVEDVPKHPRLQKRGSRYFLRVKVPTELRSAIGKREIRKALGTADPREALTRVRKASAETDAMFEAQRGNAAAAVAALAPASPVDLERVVRQELYKMEQQRAKGYSEADDYDAEDILEVLREDEAVLSRGVNEATQGSMFSAADKLLEKHGLYIDRDSSAYERFADQILRAELEIVR